MGDDKTRCPSCGVVGSEWISAWVGSWWGVSLGFWERGALVLDEGVIGERLRSADAEPDECQRYPITDFLDNAGVAENDLVHDDVVSVFPVFRHGTPPRFVGLGFLEEKTGVLLLRLCVFKRRRAAESGRPFRAFKSRQRIDRLLDVRPTGSAFVWIGLGMPRALIYRECREAIATQFGHFLRSVFGVEVVTANAASLISTVEEHHQLQAARRVRASAHSAPPGVLWV